MPRFACPVCGDPNGFPIWIDSAPPRGCPQDDSWADDDVEPLVQNVTQCAYQMNKARHEALKLYSRLQICIIYGAGVTVGFFVAAILAAHGVIK